MNKTIFLALLITANVAGKAYAKFRLHSSVDSPSAPPMYVSPAWSGPMSDFFHNFDMQIIGLGSRSLSHLANLDLSRLERKGIPAKGLNRLINHLQAMGYTPEFLTSDKLRPAKTLQILNEAAQSAEKEAERQAQELFSSVERRSLDTANVLEADRLASALDDGRYYLDSADQAKLAELRGRIKALWSLRRDKLELFHSQLPARITARAFDATNTFVKTEDGWIVADYSPFPEFASLREAYEHRLEDLSRAPAGIWSLDMLDIMEDALYEPRVAKDFAIEDNAPAWDALRQRVGLAKRFTARKVERSDDALETAREAVQEYAAREIVPRPRDILRLQGHYDSLFRETTLSPAVKWRMADWLRGGNAGEGYPSWSQLEDWRRQAAERAHFKTAVSAYTAFAALLAIPFTASVAAPALMLIPLGVMIAAMAYMFLAARQRDSLSSPAASKAKHAVDRLDQLAEN